MANTRKFCGKTEQRVDLENYSDPDVCRSLQRRGRAVNLCRMNELVFEVTQEADGGFVAEALGESIFTEADTWDALRANVREAVRAFYFDRPAPAHVRLHLVRDEVLG